MDKILITGAKGFFASRFIDYHKDKYEILEFKHSELDITDESNTTEVLLKHKPAYVIHAAAISDTGLCERNPEASFNVNVKGTANIARACSVSKSKMIYLSSDQIYNGNTEPGPYAEDCEVKPETVYGRHKLQAEEAIWETTDNAVVLRLTWLFSLPERLRKTNSNLIWNVVKAGVKGESLRVPHNEYRGITYVYDLIEKFSSILQLPGGIYNTGSENSLSTYETAELVLRELGLAGRINDLLIKDEERYKERKRDLRISNRKLREFDICFEETEEAVRRCVGDFGYRLV